MDFLEHANHHHHIREALATALNERQPVDPALRLDRLCPTGCWIHGEGSRRWAGSHAFLGLLEAHRAFHQQAGLVADLINCGRWAEAHRSLRQDSPFAMAVTDLGAALRRMRAAAGALAAN